MQIATNFNYVYQQTAAWRLFHQDFSTYVVWLDDKPWDSGNSLEELLGIFRLNELDFVVSALGEIFKPFDGRLTCISRKDSFVVDESDMPVTVINTRSGNVMTTTAQSLCLMTHCRTLNNFQEAIAKNNDVMTVVCSSSQSLIEAIASFEKVLIPQGLMTEKTLEQIKNKTAVLGH